MNMSSAISTAARRAGRRPLAIILVGAAVLLAGVSGTAYVLTDSGHRSTGFPHNAAMEVQLGVRFSRVAVVGDGGLVTVTYVVLDSEKATRFQADAQHRPVLVSEARDGSAKRVALMKQGHTLRSGQTYYFVYQNPAALLRHGERATIIDGQLRLEHVPVL